MPTPFAWLLLVAAPAVPIVAVLVYLSVKYDPIIVRIFATMPVFQPVKADPVPGGEEVRFATEDGQDLAGTYYATASGRRLGLVVFCHEFLGDRHSAHHYADHLLAAGFDVFAFDFRNHGDSTAEPGFEPIQWVSDRDRRDLRAALAYLRTRPDRDPAGVGLFGVSRGGGVALCTAADEPGVWALATDGAFPTRGTMLAYILRWAEIYLPATWMVRLIPRVMYHYVGWTSRRRAERRLGRKFLTVERAVARLGPRPWLAIHGERDNYIGPEIARDLFDRAPGPKEFWLVKGAKHNRCREVAPDEYRRRVAEFFLAHAPRRPSGGSAPGDDPAEAAEAPSKRKRRNRAARIGG